MHRISNKKKNNNFATNFNKVYSYMSAYAKELQVESEQYTNDWNKYKFGIFLWFKEKYPHFRDFLSIIFNIDQIFDFPILNNMKAVVDDYFKLLADVESSSLDSFRIEISESKEQVFNKIIKPIDTFTKKRPVMNAILKELNQLSTAYLEPVVSLIYRTIPEIKNKYESVIEMVKDSKSKILKLVAEELTGKINIEQYEKSICELNESILRQKELVEQDGKHMIEKKQSEIQEVQHEIEPLLDPIRIHSSTIYKAYTEDPIVIIYDYLQLAKDIDSFNIIFTKFIHRLFHILKNNDRNFKEYYQPEKSRYSPRSSLKEFVSGDLKKHYPFLAEFLLKFLNYNKLRNIEAHEIPNIVKLSDDKKFAYIPITGDSPDEKMNIEEAKCMVNTYCFFISGIGI